MRTLRRILILWLALAAAVGVLLCTPAGTGALLAAARLLAPGELDWDWVEGVPAGPLRVHGLRYADGRRRIRIARAEFDWRPLRLLAGELAVRTLRCSGVRWREGAAEGGPDDSDRSGARPPFSPFAVRLREGRLEDVLFTADDGTRVRIRTGRLRGRLQGNRLEIGAAFDADLPQGRLHQGRLRLAGTFGAARLEGGFALPAFFPGPVSFSGKIGWQARGIVWHDLAIRLDSAMRLASEGRLHPETGEFDARVLWERLAWPLQGVSRLASGKGELRIRGRPEDWRLRSEFTLAGRGLPEGRWRLEGRGTRTVLRIARLEGQVLDGRITARGRIVWRPHPVWSLRVEGSGLDPARWPAARAEPWAGRLAFALQTEGAWEAAGIRGRLALESLSGTLRGRPVRAEGRLGFDPDGVVIDALRLVSGRSRVRVQGRADRAALDIAWQAEVSDLDDFLPQAAGTLTGKGRVSGPLERLLLAGKLEAQGLRYRMLSLAQASLHWQAGVGREAPVQVSLRGRGLKLGAGGWSQFGLEVEGTGAAHRIRLSARGRAGRIRAQATGKRAPGVWEGDLLGADWLAGPFGDWRLAAPAHLRWRAGRLDGGPLCWIQAPARLCLRFPGDSGVQRLRVTLQEMPVQRLAVLTPRFAELGMEARLRLDAEFRVGALPTGSGRLCLSSGRIHVLQGGVQRTERFDGGCVAFRQNAGGFHAEGALHLDEDDGVTFLLALPGYRPGASLRDQPVQAELRLAVQRLERLLPWLPGVDRLEGRLAGELRLEGPLERPRHTLSLTLDDGVLGLPATGVDWRDVRLALRSMEAGAGVSLHARARSGKGDLEAEGRLALASLSDWNLQVRIRGREFLAAALPEAEVVVSPDLTLAVQPRRIDVQGTMRVPRARLRPRRLAQPVAVSPDAVIVGQDGAPTASRPPWRITARVRLLPGEDVWIEAKGLKARLGGDLTIVDTGTGVPIGRGTLSVREGSYRLQGTPLAIRRGRLLYVDTPLEDPGLDILLERKADDAVVRARLAGTLRKPVLTLSSEPPLSQTDMLSILLTGRRAGEAGPAQGRLLLEAARELGLAGGNLLGARIARAFGLDEARIELGDTLDAASLALGAWLSPRLHVSWTLGLFDPVAALRIRYRLSRHLQLEVRSSAQGTGGDLLYTIEK